MNDEDVTWLGQLDFREDRRTFGIKRTDRRFHIAVIGRTGTGKSTLLGAMMRSDAAAGEGFALIDPHGDLAVQMRDALPANRRADLIYLDAGSAAETTTFNPLELHDGGQRHLLVADLISIFERIWRRSWGPRLEYILRNVLMALTERPGYTLLDTLRLLTDKEFRREVVAGLADDVVQRFWVEEYEKYSKAHRTEAIAPIQNKLGEFLVNPVLRRLFSSPTSSFDVRRLIDSGGILIADLSIGRLGRDATSLLGALLVGKIGLAALSRADTPMEQRRDFYLYVDEFPIFATSTFETILAEARKYRLSLTLAMQYFDQLDEKLTAAVLGNTGSLISFRVGVRDAGILEKEFHPVFDRNDLVAVKHLHAYVKLTINGAPARPFSAVIRRVTQRS